MPGVRFAEVVCQSQGNSSVKLTIYASNITNRIHVKGNKLTTCFRKITNVLDNVKNQDEYRIYVSMLVEEEIECLRQAQRLQTRHEQALVGFPDRHRREHSGAKEEGEEELCRPRLDMSIGAEHARRVDPFLSRLIVLSSHTYCACRMRATF